MKKIVYKSIFSIVIMLFAFLMLPNKQVKAQEEQTFPEVIMKVPYYTASWDNTYTSTYEFTIKYRLNNLVYPFTNSLNENDYFLITGLAIQKGIPSTSIANIGYELKEIQIEDNYTIFSIRLVIPKTLVHNLYGGPEYMFAFFENDSSFYIKYNVYQYGYDLGYMVGYGDGYNFGLEQSYWEGHQDGYEYGYLVGYDDGENAGYNAGYDYGYNVGYDEGKEYGINFGREHWYNVGYEYGYNAGYDDGENAGYNDGFKAGEKSKIAQNNESFYKSIEKWLVPAIITVIVLGGIVSIIAIKRREQ